MLMWLNKWEKEEDREMKNRLNENLWNKKKINRKTNKILQNGKKKQKNFIKNKQNKGNVISLFIF